MTNNRRRYRRCSIRTFTVAVLLAGVRGLQPVAALAASRDRGYRGDRVEDRWDAGTTGLIGALIGKMIDDGDVVCR